MSWLPTTLSPTDMNIDDGTMNSTTSISMDEVYGNLQQYLTNRAVDPNAYSALIATYSILIVTGATGNGLVCLVVARKPQMRTARNIFIINLAFSDLLLCLFTMPISLSEILLKQSPFGDLMCKIVNSLEATSIYVSTMSITAIALDRYNVIVYPTREWTKKLGAFVTLTGIWVVAALLSLPLFIVRKLDRHYVGIPQLEYVVYCFEEWPLQHGRGYYSLASMIFQYVLPIVIVSVAYARICRKLQHRMSLRLRLNCNNSVNENEQQQRMRKTNVLLILIAVIFVISWLPLNIFNMVTDWYFYEDSSHYRVIFACCHVTGMSSACSNPLLYGWLNDNFRKEFLEVFSKCYGCFNRLLKYILPKNHHNSSPVPLVIYTKQSLIAHDGQMATYSRNGDDDTMTVVTQLTPPNT